MKEYLSFSPEVQEALKQNKPIVALESTIISHGMPYPQNVETAALVEQTIRDLGAVPATIAIMNGTCKVGLTKEEIDILGKSKNVHKVSRRDLAYVIYKKELGATTVASTMMIAAAAGIKVFVTGGIGGVHRGGEDSLDISRDLEELATSDVAVVCAGAKAILDLGRTLEVLETLGVPVLGYQTKTLPAFYSRESDFEVDYSFDQPSELAAYLRTKHELKLSGGVLITNPIPEEHAYDPVQMEKTIQIALQEAEELGITGKEVTPFLLAKIKELTSGESLESNIALVLNNATLGAQIAVSYTK